MQHYMKSFNDFYRKSLFLIALFALIFYIIPLLVLLFNGIQISSRSIINVSVLLILLRNTLILCISIVFVVLIAILVSYKLFLHHKRTSSFLVVMLVPFIIPCSLLGRLAYLFFAYDGPIHVILSNYIQYFNRVDLLSSVPFSYSLLIFLICLSSIAECIIYLLAGLSRLPYSIVEAAQCDGATNITILYRIVVPFIIDSIVLYAFSLASWISTASYALIRPITGGGPGLATTTFDYYIIRQYFNVSGIAGETSATIYSILIFIGYCLVLIPFYFFYRRKNASY